MDSVGRMEPEIYKVGIIWAQPLDELPSSREIFLKPGAAESKG